MPYAKRLNIVRRRLKVKEDCVKGDVHNVVEDLANRLGLRGFAQHVKNQLYVELEGREILIQEFIQSFTGHLALETEAQTFDIETIALVGESDFEFKGIDSKK